MVQCVCETEGGKENKSNKIEEKCKCVLELYEIIFADCCPLERLIGAIMTPLSRKCVVQLTLSLMIVRLDLFHGYTVLNIEVKG